MYGPMRISWLLLIAACGTSTKGTMHVVRGASTQAAPRVGGAPAVNGHWNLSPTAGTIAITHLSFHGPNGGDDIELSGCKPAFTRDVAELTSIADCGFDLDGGTYTSVAITVAAAATVTIDDATAGLYTDGAGLATAAPAGGAQPSPIALPADATILAALPSPLVVGDKPTSITVYEDMFHTVAADVSADTATFDTSAPLVSLLATAGAPSAASVEYYSATGVADSSQMAELGSVRVLFLGDAPSFLWHDTSGNGESFAADPRAGQGTRAGGYLGIDANGTVCWAETISALLSWPEDNYTMLCRMQHLTRVGDSTRVECETTKTVPGPTSGTTYATGCPSFTPTASTQVTLVAR